MSITITQRLGRHTKLIQQRQVQVRERRVFRIDEVAAALQRPGASAYEERWQRTVRVPVAVADAGAKKKDDMIQQLSLIHI